MEKVVPTETKVTPWKNTLKTFLLFISIAAIIAAAILLSSLQLQSPKVAPSTSDPSNFSAERAFAYLEDFAVAPHPVGSKEHDRVRDYLIDTLEDLGLSPHIQKANSVYTHGSFITGGTVENIVAKIEGTDSTKTLMLVAHYDSVPGGPGVGDDGAGVAAILETARILKEQKPLKNDVIILLTDGEENGLLGANAFVEEHPWAGDVGLALNFEGRGNEGPVFMFETSENNGWLIKEFVKAAPSPVAYSFIYSLYKMMPNDSDMTVFKQAGLNGLNLAFGEGLGHYHTTSDNLQELSKKSLQHHGEYMVSLARHFGELDLTQTTRDNRLFFNIFGSKVITYSEKLVIPLMLVIVAVFVLTVVHGYKRNRLSLLGTLAGFLIALGGMIGSFAIGAGLWRLLTAMLSEKDWIMGTDISFGTTYLISFSIIIFSFLNILYRTAHKKIMVDSLTMGAMLIWLILAITTSLFLKPASYVFVWPLFFALAGYNIYIRLKENEWNSSLVTASFAIPAFLILCPVIYLTQMLLSMERASLFMILVCLLGILLAPIFSTLIIKYNWVMPAVLLAIGLTVTILNSININKTPTPERPQASDVIYIMNLDTNKAYWASRHSLDAYSSNYIQGDVKEGNMSEFFPLVDLDVIYSEADLYRLESPTMILLSDKKETGKRIIEYQLKSNRQANEIFLKSFSSMNISELAINGKKVKLTQNNYTKEQPLLFQYVIGQTKEVNMKITVSDESTIDWILVDRSYSIPETKGKRSPEYSTYGDDSFILKTIHN